MAFTAEEHIKLRNAAEKKSAVIGQPVRWVKVQMQTLFTDLDTWLESEKPNISTEMDTSVPELSLTNAEKKWMFAIYMGQKFRKDIV